MKQRVPIYRADGITPGEKYLKRLCDHTFLSLWSYPGVFRDQSASRTGHGKEVCDLLVVFEEHVIIFSDKDCEFPSTSNLDNDWRRWFRRAVLKATQQIWGAERWIQAHPDRLFLDGSCTIPFPIALPDPSRIKFHRVVVAHGVAERCRSELGGSGSLMIVPGIIGDAHYTGLGGDVTPFAVGQISPGRGYVHVLDDTSLEAVLGTLDTVTDFVSYLSKKEAFVGSGQMISAAGEDDLLAFYLGKLNEHGEHDFVLPSGTKGVVKARGFGRTLQKVRSIKHKLPLMKSAIVGTLSSRLSTGTYLTIRSIIRRTPELTPQSVLSGSLLKSHELADDCWRDHFLN